MLINAAGNQREEGAEAAAHALDRLDRATAILCTSDVLALGVLDALRVRGLQAGRDVSVTGFDDIPEADAAGLTTIRQPSVERGRLAGELLLDPPEDPGCALRCPYRTWWSGVHHPGPNTANWRSHGPRSPGHVAGGRPPEVRNSAMPNAPVVDDGVHAREGRHHGQDLRQSMARTLRRAADRVEPRTPGGRSPHGPERGCLAHPAGERLVDIDVAVAQIEPPGCAGCWPPDRPACPRGVERMQARPHQPRTQPA